MDSLKPSGTNPQTGSPSRDSDNAAPSPEVPITFSAWLRSNAPGLVIMLGLVIAAYMFLGEDGLWNAAKVVMGLGFLIFVHELGHFAVAKWCDVYVETFSIGFGPALPGCSFKRGETTYKLALFPLGGYVKMLGEGEGEGEEDDDNPRSFKNKSVGQRMAIISAGVVMNILFACIFFVWAYLAHGEKRVYGVVGAIEPGTPAWENGVRSDARFLKIGTIENPYFDDFRLTAMLSSEGEQIPVVYTAADSPREKIEVQLEARRDKYNLQPMIGMLGGRDLKLIEKHRRFSAPTMPGSPAAAATPPFAFGDVILGTTDPYKPNEVTAIRGARDTLEEAHIRHHEYRQRLIRLADQKMVFQVRRAGPEGKVENIEVGPAYHRSLGLQMRMGQIVAIRHNSPASEAGIRVPDPAKNQDGDIIVQVEVEDGNGKKLRFGGVKTGEPGVDERELDPSRLPWELRQWALRTKGERQVHLTVLRKTDTDRKPITLKPLKWDEQRQFDREDPNQLQSPQSIPSLGLAYHILTAVEEVQPDSPAHKAGIQGGDVIKEVRFRLPSKKPGEAPSWDSWKPLESNQWACVATTYQQDVDSNEIGLRMERAGASGLREVTLAGTPDLTWPRAERGLYLDAVEHLQHANGSFFKALELGVNKTYRSVVTIYLSLKSMIFGRISVKNLGGPIMIARVAYDFAGQSFYEFLMLLAVISVNLAVVNFLPIPVLDGGHMVLLTYEKLRGKAASDKVQYWATVGGIATIAAIFLFASYQDIMRWLF